MMFFPDHLKTYPKEPGVYLMKDSSGTILYVGKAKDLRARLKQYFAKSDSRPVIPHLLSQISSIDTIVVLSEKEALLLENNLIKKHQPKYNALLKDDKSFVTISINHKHPWPMVRIVRYKGKPPANALYFGPYTNGYAAKQTLELLRRLFPLRQCSDRELINRSRPCILYDLKKCVAPCVGKCSKEDYDGIVRQVIHFLKGNQDLVVKELKEEMERASEALAFEKAQALLTLIQAIESTLEVQSVEKVGAEDFDVIGLYRPYEEVFLSQMQYRSGKLIGTHDLIFPHNAQEDDELLASFLLQHYGEEKSLPKTILLPFPLKEGDLIASLLSEKGKKVSLLSPKKGEKRRFLEIAEKNAKAKFERERNHQDEKEHLLMTLEETLALVNYPNRIECFDNSNLSGSEPVSALVVFTAGQKDPKEYRKYKIHTPIASDDYGALREVLTRRYKKAEMEGSLPDLLVIDGGKGHLNVALEVLSFLNITTVDVIAVAKEDHKHTKGMTLEEIHRKEVEEPLILKGHSPILLFLQQVRDEAHRFALTFQRLRRGKKSLSSALDTLPGIGPIKRKRLLVHFGSLERILAASPEELLKVKGITKKDVETLASLKKSLRQGR